MSKRGPKANPESKNTAFAFAANDELAGRIAEYVKRSGSKTVSLALLQIVLVGLDMLERQG